MVSRLAVTFLVLAACAPRETAGAATPSVALVAPPIGSSESSSAAPRADGLTITVSGDRIDLGRSPTFVTNSGELTTDPDNELVLRSILDYLSRHSEVTKLRLEVHSDGQGADAYNMRLTQERADHLAGVLMDRGVAPARLHPVGYGKTRPIAPNMTAEGRAKNRRVELHVEELDGAPIGNRSAPP